MNTDIREVLIESHVAAIAIAVLLLWFIDLSLRAIWEPIYRIGSFFIAAVAILDIPYFQFGASERFVLVTAALFAMQALICLCLAWALSWSVYRASPFSSLVRHRKNSEAIKHV